MDKLTLKSRLPIILAIGVPVLFLLVVILTAWLPSLLARPQYDFVYYTAKDYARLGDAFVLEGGSLKRACSQAGGSIEPLPMPAQYTKSEATTGSSDVMLYRQPDADCEAVYKRFSFYRYDVKAKKSIKLTEQQALALKLSDERISPDGYTLERGGGSGLWFAGDYGSDDNYYLKGKGASVELGELQTTTSSRYSGGTFVGWVQ